MDFFWLAEICDRLQAFPQGHSVWTNGSEILCATEDAANAIADLLSQLHASDCENLAVTTGYYDPEGDKRNGEEDEYTGWWYVTIE